jgi:predicted amidohydrolase
VAEEPIGAVSSPLADFAKSHHCNVVCPIYTKENGICYNAALFLDRQGRVIGEYRKMHPTTGELEQGVVPGPLDPPICKTDFRIVGCAPW